MNDLQKKIEELQNELNAKNDTINFLNRQLDLVLNSNVNTMVVVADTQETISIFNTGAENLFGYKREEVVGKLSPVHLHKKEEMEARMMMVFEKTGKKLFGAALIREYLHLKLGPNEWTFIKKDGSEITIHLIINEIFDEQKNVIGYIGIGTDLTDTIETKTKLDKTTNILKAVIDADINAMIIASDKDEKVTIFSKGAEKLLGYDAAEVINTQAGVLYHDIEEVIERVDFLEKIYHKKFEGAEIVSNYNKLPNTANEWTFTKKDGTKFPVNLVISKIKDEQNNLIGYVGIASDISQMVKYREDLEKKNEELVYLNTFHEKINSLSPSSIYVYNVKENKNSYNNEAINNIMGYTAKEVKELGSNFLPSILFEEDRDRVLNRMLSLKTLKDEEQISYEYRIKHKNGNTIHLYANERAFSRDENGNVVEIIGIATDITLLKKYQNELEDKNKELEQFIYIASHDLQEPLRTLSSFTNLFLAELKATLSPNQEKYATFMLESAARMKTLITNLLNYSKLGANKNLELVNINEMLEEVKNDLNIIIEENNAIIEYETLPTMLVYRTELRLLFQNIIQNAIKFKQKTKAPIIQIKADLANNEYHFSIADNGIGINQKYFDRIFLIFQQLETDQLKNGSGIGLAHSKKIVALHGGKIWVQSTENEGTTFHFTIPIQK